VWNYAIEAMNNNVRTTNAGAFNFAPGGVLVEVTLKTRLATKRVTGSNARVSTIKGVKPG
jgi:hypothetical protein